MFGTRKTGRRDGSTSSHDAPTTMPEPPRNLAARMGRWSAAHWKTATFGWLAFVLVAFALGGAVGMKTIDPDTRGRASPAAWTGSSRPGSSSPPARAS